MMEPIQMKFLGVNKADKWWRYQYLEMSSYYSPGDLTSHPASEWGRSYCETKEQCIVVAIQQLLDQLKEKTT
jgi:hypothetical protein